MADSPNTYPLFGLSLELNRSPLPWSKIADMKSILRLLPVLIICLLIFGCNVNPSKEARLQQLEADVAKSLETIKGLEAKVARLEIEHGKLELLVGEE